MSAYKPYRQQTHKLAREKSSPQWSVLKVDTRESWDESKTANYTTVRVSDTGSFVDIGIEEFTGETRRAKLCSVRLEEPAARALFEQLRNRFANQVGL
mgnify:FL=1